MTIDFSFLDKKNLHHAYLIEGEYGIVAPVLIAYLKKSKIIASDSDLYQSFAETFSIDLSRVIKSQQVEKSASKFFILGANFFGREAANALLKVFEEPTAGVHFFLITPNPHLLPATLRSRLQKVSADNKKTIIPEVSAYAKQFLGANKANRIKMLDEVIKKFKKEKESKDEETGEKGLKSWAIELLNAVEIIFHQNNLDIKSKLFEFEELQKCRGYMSDNGASAKMLLEHLALILTTTK